VNARARPGLRRAALAALAYAAVAVLLVIVLFPIVWILLTGFKTQMDAFSLPPKWVFRPTVENYVGIFHTTGNLREIPFATYFWNSVVVTLSSTALSLVVALFAGYSLARLAPRGAGAIGLGILAVRMLPPIVLVVPLYVLCQRAGLLDTVWALIFPYTALNIPLATWLLRSFLQDLPRGLEEAAMVDGCSPFGAFWRVIVPLAAPGLAATAVFSFILGWNDLVLALPLTTFHAPTLPILASRVRVDEGVLWGRLGAVATVLIVPVLLFTFAAQRYIVRGLAAGAVKE